MSNRANEELYLKMIPVENMENLPSQRRIANLPISLRKGVEDFLNNIGRGLGFE